MTIFWPLMVFALLFGGMLTTEAGAAKNPSLQSPRQKVVLQLRRDHQFQFAGYYAALWQGYYAEAGLDVEIRPAWTGHGQRLAATREVSEGRADFGVGAGDILIARDNGADLLVLGVIFQRSPVAWYSLADTGQISLERLPELKVLRVPGGSPDAELRALLQAGNIDPASVPYQTIPSDGNFEGALFERAVDVISGYTIATPYRLRAWGGQVSEMRAFDYGIEFYGDTLFTHRRVIDRNSAMVKRFRDASLKGWRYALKNPQEIAEQIAASLSRNIPDDNPLAYNLFQADRLKEIILYPVIQLGHMHPGRWRDMHHQLRRAGVLKNRFEVREFIFDPERLEQEAQALQRNRIIMVIGITIILVAITLCWNLVLRAAVRRRTAELRQTEERLDAQFQNMPVPTFCWQRSGDDFVRVDRNIAANKQYGGITQAWDDFTANEILSRWPEGLSLLHQCYSEQRTRWILKSSATPEVLEEGLGGRFIAEAFSGG